MIRLYNSILFTILVIGVQAQTIQQLKDSAAAFPAMPRSAADLFALIDNPVELTFASSTPYNDVEYSLFDTDYIEGETAGYDVFCPVDPGDEFPGSNTVKLILCVSNVLTSNIYGAARGHRVILGLAEDESPFFLRGSDGIDNDYAVIRHFDFIRGHIQLNGQPADYKLIYAHETDGVATEGWYLFYTKEGAIDLVAFVFPCWDVDEVLPNQDSTLMCNADQLLDLQNSKQFRFAEPLPPEPAINSGLVQFGSEGKEIVHGVVVDDDGCIYAYGTGDGNLDGGLDPDQEMFVAKFDASGKTMWVTEFGESNGNLIFDATVDSAHLYAAGRTLGRLPGFQNQGLWDAILVKIRLDNGDIAAMDQWGAAGIDGYGNITLDDAGNLYLSGAGSLPGGSTSGDNRYLVAKHSSETLENIWRALDPVLPAADKVTEAWGGITYVPNKTPGTGKLVIGGWFRPPGSPPRGADGFVSLYGDLDQASPRILAVHQLSSPGFRADWVLDNCIDSGGNIYAAGYTTGEFGGKQQGQGDMFVVKLDSNLSNPQYVQWGTAWSDMFRKLVIDDQDHLYAIGYTYGDYAGSNPDTSRLTGDVVIQKFDTDLNRLARIQFGTPGEERGFLHVQDPILYVAGMTEGSLAGTNLGSFDGFVVTFNSDDLSFTRIQTSVHDQDFAPERPEKFSLYHIYPNPFNSATTISYQLTAPAFITINVVNTAGKTVATLVNDKMPSGSHHVIFDATHLPSGVYYCRFKAADFIQSRKLLYLR